MAMDPALEALLNTQPALWRGGEQHSEQSIIKTGFSELDKALPGGGWQTGTLTELLIERSGIGEFSLLLPVLQSTTNPTTLTATEKERGHSIQHQDHTDQWSALVNPPFIPYAPALANAGVQLDRLLIIDARNDDDTLWSTEQLLRAGIFTTVICWINKTDSRRQRRLQLAAETGQSLAIAYRPATAARNPSPAALRIHLSCQREQHNGLTLKIVKSRGLKRSSLTINPHHFDAPQGIEWPGFNPTRDESKETRNDKPDPV